MESLTHESEESSSCTQSDGDSTNSSNGTNPFLLCPRANSSLHLELGGQGRTHDTTEDMRPFKLARMEPPRHHPSHASAVPNPLGAGSLQYAHNVVGAIRGADCHNSSALLSQSRSYASTAFEDRRIPGAQAPSAARSYLGSRQAFITPDQWTELRQQTYVLKHVAAPPSALQLPMNCKVENVPVNFGTNAGSYFLGLADPQPGRCRRTDGKKWRCGRAVVPDQKYCERHMHRGRGRSKAARLAKVNVPVNGNQPPPNSARPLNQPLIQLLNQLAVPGQPLNQPPEPAQKPPIPAKPLQWLGNPVQPFLQVRGHLSSLGQPLHAEPLSQVPSLSKPLDWALNQTPMEAEPLNIVHASGVPPNLAQAIPINTVSEIKSKCNAPNGTQSDEARRAQADDYDDVFTLDVQGLKRLLENAPCNLRFRKLANQQKQLPNLADLLNVAHLKSPTSQPKRPPSLMEVLKMVDPCNTATAAATTTTAVDTGTNFNPNSVIDHQLRCITKDNGTLPVNSNQIEGDSPTRGHAGAPLLPGWSDEQAALGQSRKCSSSTAVLSGLHNLVGARQNNDTSWLKLIKVKCEEDEGEEQNMAERVEQVERACLLPVTSGDILKISRPSEHGWEHHDTNVNYGMTSKNANSVQSEPYSLGECIRSSAISEKPKAKENSPESCKNTLTLVEAHLAETDENSPNLAKESLKGCDYTTKLCINCLNPGGEECNHPGNLKESWKSSQDLRESTSKHHESSLESGKGILSVLERGMDHGRMPDGPKKIVSCLLEQSQEQDEPCASPHSNPPISVRKSSNSPVNLDMNSLIYVEESLGRHGDSGELEKNHAVSGSMPPVPQIKSAFDKPSDSNCNVNSSSKSALILEPVALNNPEPLSSQNAHGKGKEMALEVQRTWSD